jgi:3-oxoacyl-[acyl-carrier-protein] synthase II
MGKDDFEEVKKRVVITGLGVISPNGIGKEAFFKALVKGKSGIKPITLFDTSFFKTKLAGECTDFNAEEFLGSKGLRNLDRATKLVCSAAKLALEDAALEVTEENTDDIGVVTATTLSAIWDLAEFSKEVVQEGPQFASPGLFPPTTMNFSSSQVSIWHKIKGFNTTISTGYTAGLDSLKYALDFIKLGRAKAVLVAGVESLSFSSFVGFHKIGFLAGLKGEEICCPFDKRRNGIVLGEGSVVLVVEDEEYAKKRGARIYGEVLSVVSTFDAYRAAKYDPRYEGLMESMNSALQKSGLSEEDIDYICAAANSVIQQDKLETLAIKNVFTMYAKKTPISSIKSMVGESVSAAGCFQVAASVASITEGFIPPTINYQEPDPDCDLDCVPNISKKQALNNVLINCFGPGGNNATAIIAKYN